MKGASLLAFSVLEVDCVRFRLVYREGCLVYGWWSAQKLRPNWEDSYLQPDIEVMQSRNSGAHFNLPLSQKNLERVRQLVDRASDIISRFQVVLVANPLSVSTAIRRVL